MPPPRDPVDAAVSPPADSFAALPDPGRAASLSDLVERLRLLKVWARDPSYDAITDRVNAAWRAAGRPAGELARRTTVADCFRPGRRRLNTDLVLAVVHALHPDVGYVAQWSQALRVVGGETQAASQVRVQGILPLDLVEFTGRAAELDQLRRAVHRGRRDGGTVVISAIEGMAGVGKTQLAVHSAHMLSRETPFDRVLFVNLRGFHPDPTQPPADPAAVLDGFLRLLGLSGQQIPHGLDARAATYRDRLIGTRTLVVLDNAADVDQIRPLLAGVPGCLTLVTSRRRLAELRHVTHLTVDVFTPDEAVDFLARTAPHVPAGPDPTAARRIAHRCGYLPLALGLVAGQIRSKPGWTLTDHADRLDERHQDRRLDSGVELAFDLSYHHLPADERRLLRLAALHPGQDFDVHAAAALADVDLSTVQSRLRRLCQDHLLLQTAGRYTFHDLVRAYATGRAGDEDSPRERRAALTRLFDYYLAAAAVATETLYPAETSRPLVPRTIAVVPDLADPDAARAWLDTERPTLIAVAVRAARNGWPTHTVKLASLLYRYLYAGHHADALTVHGHAHQAARHLDDRVEQANALTRVGVALTQLGRHHSAADHFQEALPLFRDAGDRVGEARALGNLGLVEERLGRYRLAVEHSEGALKLYRLTGNHLGEARALGNLGLVEQRLRRFQSALDHHTQALALFRRVGDQTGEADTLNNLGDIEVQMGRYEAAADYQQQALTLFRKLNDHEGEGWALSSLGVLHTHLGEFSKAAEYHQRALTLLRETGNRDGQTSALNGLGEAAHAAGQYQEATTHHAAALTIATELDLRNQQARAHTGLANAHNAIGDDATARRHHHQARTLNTELGVHENGPYPPAGP